MAPRRRRRTLTEAEQREQTVRDGNLQALAKHPAWPDLEASVGLKVVAIERILLGHVLAPNEPVDQRLVDHWRGFIDGMQWLVRQPLSAENRLERQLQERGVTAEGDSQ